MDIKRRVLKLPAARAEQLYRKRQVLNINRGEIFEQVGELRAKEITVNFSLILKI